MYERSEKEGEKEIREGVGVEVQRKRGTAVGRKIQEWRQSKRGGTAVVSSPVFLLSITSAPQVLPADTHTHTQDLIRVNVQSHPKVRSLPN